MKVSIKNYSLLIIFKEIYDNKIKKSNNYNLYSFNFDYIERILVDKLIRNVSF